MTCVARPVVNATRVMPAKDHRTAQEVQQLLQNRRSNTGYRSHIRLKRDADNILLEDGTVLFEGLNPVASLSVVDDDCMVLGFEAAGPVDRADFPIGKFHFTRFLASARCKLWWMTPEWGTKCQQLPPETQFLLAEVKEGGPYVCLLPLIDEDTFRGTLWPPRRGNGGLSPDTLVLRMESGCETVLGASFPRALYLAAAWDPFELVDAAVAGAAALSGGAKPLWQKQVPGSLDLFGWCTWDAFYSSVSARGICDGLTSLNGSGVHPRLLIIDDGWQMTDVDRKYRTPPTTRKMPQVGVADQSYIDAEIEVLSSVARVPEVIPPGSYTGRLLEEVASVDETSEKANFRPQHQGQKAAALETVGEEKQTRVQHQGSIIKRASLKVVQSLLGFIMGVLSALLLTFYQWVVDPAPPGSWPVKLFAYLARGPLRELLEDFFATSGNFTRRLISVKANGKFSGIGAGPDEFFSDQPEDLRAVVSHLKTTFGLDHIYCWHGLSAYWAGVAEPVEREVARYQSRIVYAKPTPGLKEIEPSLLWNPAVISGVGVPEDARQLFSDMHAYLAEAGISGVKVDCQAGVGLVGSATAGGPAAALSFHQALEESVATHFPGNHVINCMCHSTENVYRHLNTAVTRASDDFYPRETASSTPHIAACAFNSTFFGALAQPDWDMFHSKHPAGELHATARAVSGGPVYISDAPGHHDLALLRRLVLPDGTVLRALLPGRPTADSLFCDVLRDGRSLLKVWNVNRYGGLVGVFNLQGSSWSRRRRRFVIHDKHPPPLTTTVHPSDVAALGTYAPVALHTHHTTHAPTGGAAHARLNGDVGGVFPDSAAGVPWALYCSRTDSLRRVRFHEGMEVGLAGAACTVVTVMPLTERKGAAIAPIGLTNMINSGGAITGFDVTDTPRPPPLATTTHNGNGHASSGSLEEEGGVLPGGYVMVKRGQAAAVGIQAVVEFKGRGEVLLYCSHQPVDCQLDGEKVDFKYDASQSALRVDVAAGLVHRLVVRL